MNLALTRKLAVLQATAANLREASRSFTDTADMFAYRQFQMELAEYLGTHRATGDIPQEPELFVRGASDRLEQVLASSEWPDDSFLEGLMLDTEGCVIEGTRTNVFAVIGGQLLTPMLDHCGVQGVMRDWLLQRFGDKAGERRFTLGQLRAAREVFVCSSVIGVWPVTQIQHGDERHNYSIGSHTRQAQAWLHELN